MGPLEADDPAWAGDYRLLARLGSGGMGRVYLARRRGGSSWVAVKLVRPEFAGDTEFRQRFRFEVNAARRVGGRWSAPLLDADTESSRPWVATAFVEGPSLGQAVERHGPLPENSVRMLVAGLAEALKAVHESELVHRDVKPANVLLALDGPRLIDFGIARATDATVSLTRTGVVVGSPGYMSPEQVTGEKVRSPTDIFALGAVLVFAATGRGPFTGDGMAGLMYKVEHEEPDLGDLSGKLREIAEACLNKDPALRPTAEEIARTLAPAGAASLAGAGWLPTPVVADINDLMRELVALPDPTDTTHDKPVPRPWWRYRRALVVAALGVLAVLISTSMLLRTQGDDVPEAFLGTWEGQITSANGLPGGTLRITIEQGSVGEVVSKDAGASYLGVSCPSDYRLVSVEDDLLVLTTEVKETTPNPLGLCARGASTSRFTLQEDGSLGFRSLHEKEGTPQGILRKV